MLENYKNAIKLACTQNAANIKKVAMINGINLLGQMAVKSLLFLFLFSSGAMGLEQQEGEELLVHWACFQCATCGLDLGKWEGGSWHFNKKLANKR
jgi:hypothetical protein